MRNFISIIMEAEDHPTLAERYIAAAKAALAPMQDHVQCDLQEDWEGGKTDHVEIEHIGATTMRQGWGTKAMTILCKLADQMGVTLTLGVANETDDFYSYDDDDDEDEPDNTRPPSEGDLIAFYDGFGFEQNVSWGDRVTMTRTPN